MRNDLGTAFFFWRCEVDLFAQKNRGLLNCVEGGKLEHEVNALAAADAREGGLLITGNREWRSC